MRPNRQDICILIASKRTIVCELYSQALNRCAGFRVVACALTANEVMHAIRSTKIDIALISLTLADGPLSGLVALQQIQASQFAGKSVLLYDRDETHLIVPAFRAGARGVFCVEKDEFKRLCRCVGCVHAGQVWANSSELIQLLDAFSHRSVPALVNANGRRLVTKREEDIVHLIEEGFTNREIASELHLSEHTVRNYLFRIFDKLGVSNRVELALFAVKDAVPINTAALSHFEKPRRVGPLQIDAVSSAPVCNAQLSIRPHRWDTN